MMAICAIRLLRKNMIISVLSNKLQSGIKKSKHYVRQSKFEGSQRQLRGKIVKEILEKGDLTVDELYKIDSTEKMAMAVDELVKEGFIDKHSGKYRIK